MLEMEPNEILRFTGPFTRPTSTTLTLINSSDSPILFKIKTTAPKLYCVRPNRGSLLSLETKMIDICLQSYEKDKHKFLVLSIPQPDGEFETFQDMWDRANALGEPHKAKLKCIFVMPEEACMVPAIQAESQETLAEHGSEPTVSHQVKPATLPVDVGANAEVAAPSRKQGKDDQQSDEVSHLDRNITQFEEELAAKLANATKGASVDKSSPEKIPSSLPAVQSRAAERAGESAGPNRAVSNVSAVAAPSHISPKAAEVRGKSTDTATHVTKPIDTAAKVADVKSAELAPKPITPPTEAKKNVDKSPRTPTRAPALDSQKPTVSQVNAVAQPSAHDTGATLPPNARESVEVLGSNVHLGSNKLDSLNNKIITLRLENEYLKRENHMLQDQIGKLNLIRKANSVEFAVPSSRVEFHTFNLLIAVVSCMIGYLMAKFSF